MEAAEAEKDLENGNDDVKESSDETAETTVSEMEVKDSEQSAEDTEISDDKQASETKSSLSAEKEEKEVKVSEVDNKDELTDGVEVQLYNKHNPNTALSTFSKLLTFTGFADPISNDHGPQTNATNATITFTVPSDGNKVADIEVAMCTYSGGTVTAKVGETPQTVISETVTNTKDGDGKNALKYTILGVKGGSTVTLTIAESGKYVHSIKATLKEAGAQTYTISVTGDDYGTASASPVFAEAGDTVTLTAKPTAGYKLDKWEVTSPTEDKPEITIDGTDPNKATFPMPAANVEIEATFVEDADATYDIKVLNNGYHGTASLKSGQNTGIKKGIEVTLADVVEATSDEGYTFKEWYVTKTADNTTTDIEVTDGKFTMPAGDVYIMPVFSGAAKDKYTYDFKNNNKTDRTKNAQLKDFGIITFDGFKDTDNDHGFITEKVNATMTLTLADKAKVTVDTCQYNSACTGVTGKIGDSEYTGVDGGKSDKDNGKKYTVTTDKGGELVLTFATNSNHVHNIKVEYIDDSAQSRDEWDFTSYDAALHTDAKFEGTSGEVAGLLIDATNGKFQENTDNALVRVNTKIKVPVTGVENEKGVKVTVQWYNGESEYTVAGQTVTSEAHKEQSVTCKGTEENGKKYVEIILKTGDSNNTNYLEKIKIAPAEDIIEDGAYIDFSTDFSKNNHKQNDEVDAEKGFSFSGFKWHSGHGITGSGTIKLNLEEGKRAKITIIGCAYGKSPTLTLNQDEKSYAVNKESVLTGSETTPKYTILGAMEAECMISFSKQEYIHYIKVEYLKNDEHLLFISSDDNGTASASITADENTVSGENLLVKAGKKVTLTAVPKNSNYGLKQWTVAASEDYDELNITADSDDANVATFTMPAGDVDITAVFELTGTPSKWDFRDGTLTGDNGIVLEGESGEVRKLKIDASSGKWDSKASTDRVQVNSGTKITVPFDGVDAADCDEGKYVLTVFGSTAAYKVNGVKANVNNGPEKFICEGSEAVIDVLANSTYLSYIEVTPFQYAEAGTINFATSDQEVINKTKGLTATNIAWHDTSHGVWTGSKDPESTLKHTIELNLSGKANVTVLSCRYGAGMEGTMEASSGTVTKKAINENGADGPQFTVMDAEAGSLLLTFGQDVYIHNIIIEYPKVITPGSRKIDVWDFAGKPEADTDTYENNITAAALISANIIKDGLFSNTGSAKFGDLTMNFNGSDRFYSTVEDASGIAQSDNESDFIKVTYEDGFESAGGFYCNGTGGSGRRNVMIDNVQAGDKITAYIGLSQNGPSEFFFEGMGAASEQKDSVDAKTGPAFQKYEFVAEYTGTYKIWENAIGKPMYHRIVRVPGVQVSGSIDFGAYTGTNHTVKFVNKTNRKETFATLDGTNYTVILAPGFEYTAILSGAPGYGFTTDTKTVAVSDAEYKTGKSNVNLAVETKDVFTYSGKIVGFAQDYKYINNLTITMTPPEDSESDIVPLTIDENLNFTAVLEQGVEYAIKIAGVDDYEVKGERAIKKTEDYVKDIIVGLKLMYPVSGSFIGLSDSAQVTELTFTILDEKGKLDSKYAYKAEVDGNGYSINLRDGDYLANAKVEGYSTQTHVTVNGAAVEKDLLFVATSTAKEDIDWAADIYVGYPDRENNYETINDAMDACERMKPAPADEEHRITVHIAPGTYREQITVKTPYVSFVNDEPGKTVLVTWYYGIGYKYYSADEKGYYNPQNAFDKFDKHIAASWGVTVTVDEKATAFRAEGITFENSFNRYITDEEIEDGIEVDTCRFERTYGADVESRAAIERAAAMVIKADKVEFKDCGFYSSQDTLYTNESSVRGYFKNCVIEGNTDYMYGGGDYVFDGCELSWKGYSDNVNQGGYITATRPAAGNKGYLFRNCIVTGNEGYTVSPGYFGRTWGADAKVVLLNTKLEKEAMIAAAGWYPMNGDPKDANYFEYNTTTIAGTAVDTSKRVRGVIDAEAAAAYTAESFFGGWEPVYYQAEAEGDVTFAETKAPKLTSNGNLSEPHPGHTLTVQYSLGAANDANDASVIQWYRVDGSTETLIKTTNASDKSYRLTNEDVGKKIKVTVIPAVFSGKKGDAASDVLGTAVLEGYDEKVEFSILPGITSNSNVNVPHPGDILTAKYALDSANHAKDASVIKWYRVKDGTETLIVEKKAPEKTYTLTAEDVGFVIKIEVTPTNTNGSAGEAKTYIMQNAVTEKNMAAVNPDPVVEDPSPNIPSETEVLPNAEITLSCLTEDAEIYYTLDGTTVPSRTAGKLYDGPIVLTADTTIMAIAVKDGWKDSNVVTFVYTVSANASPVYPPSANPLPDKPVAAGTEVILTCVPENARIYYTLDGTTIPSETTGILYEKPIKIEADTTIMAVAVKDGVTSEVSKFAYTVSKTSNEPGTGDEGTKIPAYDDLESVSISGSRIKIEAANLIANPTKAQYNVTVTYTYTKDGKAYQQQLTEGLHYTVEFVGDSDGKTADVEQKINVRGTNKPTDLGTFVNAKAVSYKLVDKKSADKTKDISKVKTISLDKNAVKDLSYTGGYITPQPSISGVEEKNADGKANYTYVYKNNVNAGKASVTVIGQGDYYGVKTLSFTIKATDLSKPAETLALAASNVEANGISGSGKSYSVDKAFAYKGSPVVLENLTLTYAGKKLRPQEDYTIAYKINVQKGTGTATIKGINNFKGSVNINYKMEIDEENIKAALGTLNTHENAVPAEYSSKGARLTEIKLSNGVTLKENVDYKVTYTKECKEAAVNLESPQELTVEIAGAGAYKNVISKKTPVTIKVVKGSYHIKDGTVVDAKNAADDKLINAAKIMDASGAKVKNVTLAPRTAGEPVTEITVIPNDKDNYEETTLPCHVATKLGGVKQAEPLADQKFDGVNSVTVTKEAVAKSLGISEKDFNIVSYKGNNKLGSATVTIEGTGLYYGTKSLKFKIVLDKINPDEIESGKTEETSIIEDAMKAGLEKSSGSGESDTPDVMQISYSIVSCLRSKQVNSILFSD